MRQSTRTRRVTVSLLGGLAIVAAVTACGGSVTPNVLTPTIPTITTLPSLDEMLSEKTLGTSSTNTIVWYVSFWSAASKDFYLTGDGAQMKSQLADTNKAQIMFRNLFISAELSTSSGVPVAAMLARCAGNARFFDAVTTIFQNQPTWLGNPDNADAAVKAVMLGFGFSQSVVNSCVSNTALATGLGQIHTNALQATYLLPDGTQRSAGTSGSIFSVPAVVVNGVLLDGVDSTGASNSLNAPTLANVQKYLH